MSELPKMESLDEAMRFLEYFIERFKVGMLEQNGIDIDILYSVSMVDVNKMEITGRADVEGEVRSQPFLTTNDEIDMEIEALHMEEFKSYREKYSSMSNFWKAIDKEKEDA